MEIIVNDKSYKFNDRLTIQQWCSVMRYDFSNAANWPTIINLITGVDKRDLIKGSQDVLELGAAIIVQMCNARIQSQIKPLDTLTFGEFVDLDSYIAMGTHQHLEAMSKILTPTTEYADEALWAIEQWANYRLGIFRQYKELFGLDDEEDLDNTDTEVDTIQHDAVARNWYKIIVDLAQDDILRLDAVTDQPLIKTLNFMALRKERQLEENMRTIEQNSKIKTQYR